MIHFGGGDSAIHAAPGHHRGVGSEAALQNLIPTHQLLPLGFENLFGAAHQVALQFLFVRQVLFGHAALALFAGFPKALVTFVAADVNVFGRKKFGDFGEDLVDELEGLLIAGTKCVVNLAIEAGAGIDMERPAGAG